MDWPSQSPDNPTEHKFQLLKREKPHKTDNKKMLFYKLGKVESVRHGLDTVFARKEYATKY